MKFSVIDDDNEMRALVLERFSSRREDMIHAVTNDVLQKYVDSVRLEVSRAAAMAVDDVLGLLPRRKEQDHA